MEKWDAGWVWALKGLKGPKGETRVAAASEGLINDPLWSPPLVPLDLVYICVSRQAMNVKDRKRVFL